MHKSILKYLSGPSERLAGQPLSIHLRCMDDSPAQATFDAVELIAKPVTPLLATGSSSSQSANSNTGAWSWPGAQSLEFGRSHDGYWRAFNGQMDDIRYYNRPLSPGEVAQIAAPIPEPSTFVLAVCSMAGLCAARHVRRRAV